jgi:CheY-like chemotaxis protein
MARILVVDDEGDSLEFVVKFLERQGHTVTSAPDGRAALASLATDRPDAVVLDVRMPNMDGIDLLEVLRSYLRWYNLPVLLLTAHATPGQLRKARELGVVYIFHKAQLELPELAAALDDATGAKADTAPA